MGEFGEFRENSGEGKAEFRGKSGIEDPHLGALHFPEINFQGKQIALKIIFTSEVKSIFEVFGLSKCP